MDFAHLRVTKTNLRITAAVVFVAATVLIIAFIWPSISLGAIVTGNSTDFTISFADGTSLVVHDANDSFWYGVASTYSTATAFMDAVEAGASHGSVRTATSIACANGVTAYAPQQLPPPPAPAPVSEPAPAPEPACVPDGNCSDECGFGVDNCGNACFGQTGCQEAPVEPAATSMENPWTNWATPEQQAETIAEPPYTGPAFVPVDAYRIIYSEPAGQQCGQQCVQNSYIYDSCTDTITYCAESCVGNACVVSTPQTGQEVVPPPTLTWTVKPSIVQKNAKTHITWQSTNTTDCKVSGSNQDTFTGVTGDTDPGTIPSQTVFTIQCHGKDGSTIQKQATVNIIPVFQEI